MAIQFLRDSNSLWGSISSPCCCGWRYVIACPHMNPPPPPILLLSCQHLLTERDAGTDVNPGNSCMLLKGLALISLFASALVPADDRLQAVISLLHNTISSHLWHTSSANCSQQYHTPATRGNCERGPLWGNCYSGNMDAATNEDKNVPL